MGHIATIYDLPKDLTTFKVVGKMRSAEFIDCLSSYYRGTVTLLNLWDATEADLSAITAAEVEELAYYGRNLAEARRGGKTAIVFDTLHGFGLGRMLQTLLEIAGLPLETFVCRSHTEAMKWLEGGGAMIVEIDIDNDNKIVRRTLRGEIDTKQVFKLVQNISCSVDLNQDYNILVDIRDTAFHPGMVDLIEIAAACSNQLKNYNKKIAFLIPNTEHRRQVAKLFRTCMAAEGFKFKQFFEYEAAMEWLSSSAIDIQSASDAIQKAS